MDLNCPKDYFISDISSSYHGHYKDRRFTAVCKGAPYQIEHASSCSYQTDYVNAFHKNFGFTCPSDGAITGMSICIWT